MAEVDDENGDFVGISSTTHKINNKLETHFLEAELVRERLCRCRA